MQFHDLGLAEPLLRAVRAAGYDRATPIQASTIPPALDGRDVLGCAQTGTGKTAAFALPLLQRLAAEPPKRRAVRALVVTPTRELAAQIGASVETYGRHLSLRHAVIFGGVGQSPQVQALRRGVDLLIATPGRLLDLIDQGHIDLGRVEILVLDEADRMLDMGFAPAIRRILRHVPSERQTLLFSATMPAEIRGMAEKLLDDPVEVSVTPQATTAETVEQRVLLVAREDKQALLAHILRDDARGMDKTLVFSRTKHGADRIAKRLGRADIAAAAIHGGKSQGQRERALAGFKRGTTRVLVASDIAARGLDIDDLSHVVNFDIPNEPETYVHRIGRTGRAGASGIAVSFCTADDVGYLRAIERIIDQDVPVDGAHPFHASFDKLPRVEERRQGSGGGRGRSRGASRQAPAARDGDRPAGSSRRRRRGRGGGRPGASAAPPAKAATGAPAKPRKPRPPRKRASTHS